MSRALFRGPTKGYTLTDADVEWLARSMWGEASHDLDRIAVAWSHINRFLLVRYRWLNEGWPFWRYVQSHSQPVNPAWRRDGKFCKPGGQYYGNQTYCSEDQLAKRDKYQTQPVPTHLLRLAEEFAQGKHPNPLPEVTYDFAACWLTRKQGRPHEGIAVVPNGNCHLPYSALKDSERGGVIPGEVRVEGATFPGTEVPLPPAEIAIPFAALLLAGTGALIAWWIFSGRV